MSLTKNTSFEILIKISIFLYRYVAVIIYIIGNLGNLVNLLIFRKRSWRKNVCVFYFITCIISSTVHINSTLLGSILGNGFHLKILNSNVILCKIYYYISYLSSAYYPTILIFASFDRLLLSSQNVDTRLYSSKRLAYLFTSVNLILWCIFFSHLLFKVNIQQVTIDQFTCTYDLSISYLNFIKYSTLILNAVMPLILIILSILAFKNVRRIRENRSHERNQIRMMNKKDFQLLRCLYVHNIVYILGNMLITVGMYYVATLDHQLLTSTQQVVINFLNQFGGFIHFIPYCSNLFVFLCVSKAFRQELKRMIYKIGGRNLVNVREQANAPQELGQENIKLNHIAVSTIVLSH